MKCHADPSDLRLAMGPRVGRRGVAKWGSVRVVAGWGYSHSMVLWGLW
jgi:hypothetical protein